MTAREQVLGLIDTLGIAGSEVARKSGLNQGRISLIYTGKAAPTATERERIADFFNEAVTADALRSTADALKDTAQNVVRLAKFRGVLAGLFTPAGETPTGEINLFSR